MPGSRPRDDWQFIALDVMPDHVHLFVKAHPTDSPSHVANQFKGLTSWVGVTHFLTTSAGEHVPNSRYLAGSAAKLARTQQALARCQCGSQRRRAVVQRVAAIHRKVRNQRTDQAHKVALDLVRTAEVIAREDLAIGNMTRSAAGTILK